MANGTAQVVCLVEGLTSSTQSNPFPKECQGLHQETFYQKFLRFRIKPPQRYLQKAWQNMGWFDRKIFENEIREIGINCGRPNKLHLDNYTSTTKYNLLTFFPKALFEQYRRVANVYFTIVAALSLTPYTPVRAWTTWTPLGIVLGVSLLKEGIEDYRRYVKDKDINGRPVDVYSHELNAFVVKRWQDVLVGDIVKVLKDDEFPADMLFLSAENEEGTCYIETMNLDGETNLKIKKALDQTLGLTEETVGSFVAKIKCEGPNSRLYQFQGNLVMDHHTIPLNPNAILLRGCSLRNTKKAYGAVIYAGHETKIFKNATVAPSKRSRIERIVDHVIVLMFAVLFAFCITGCIYFSYWTEHEMPKAWYLMPTDTSRSEYDPSKKSFVAFASFITSFILYGYLIPISLYVSMEVVKVAQAGFINHDREMYHEETDTPALARTSNLNEELGMVTAVLSDKTGTLTRNMMEYFKCSIAGVSYGAGVTEIERSNLIRKGLPVPEGEDPGIARYRERFFNFYDARLMENAWTREAEPETIEMFYRLLAVCHTVIPDGPHDPENIRYEAESPDEAALVVAAKVFGFFFFKRTSTSVFVRERTARGTADVEYEVLNVLEFNSTRKRMSVIIRDPEGRLLLLCKGADSVIYERMDPHVPANNRIRSTTSRHMEEYGGAGLRTLCLSYAELNPQFYDSWASKFVDAKTSLYDRDEKLAACAEEIERDLILLGCTAIEDKLQEGVPVAISQLAAAGIRLWVLTGDKLETAINIGYACSLITEDMSQFILSAQSEEISRLEEAGRREEAERAAHERVAEQLAHVRQEVSSADPSHQFALVADGNALSFALSKRMAKDFFQCALRCKAVICCRVSPLQKAQVTALVRKHGEMTLAIGDGANDVGMIQRAHIGVGISGQEGMQAVMSSDFAIAQFRFLVPLLLVHGRYSYKRLTRMVLFFFYKNLLFGVTIFTFNAFNNFSGQYVYNDFYMTLFNVIFTALTPVIIGIFDRDVDKHAAYKFPGLYKQGQLNMYFNRRAIALWMLSALYQAGMIMTLTLLGCRPIFTDRKSGQTFSLYQTGVQMMSCVLLTVHFQIAQVIDQWTWAHHFSVWVSLLVWWLFLVVIGWFPMSLSDELYDLFIGVNVASPQYWLYILLVPVVCQLPDFFVRLVWRRYFPADHHIVQEIELRERKERRRAGKAAGSGSSTANMSQQLASASVFGGVGIGASSSTGESNPGALPQVLNSSGPGGSWVSPVKGRPTNRSESSGGGSDGTSTSAVPLPTVVGSPSKVAAEGGDRFYGLVHTDKFNLAAASAVGESSSNGVALLVPGSVQNDGSGGASQAPLSSEVPTWRHAVSPTGRRKRSSIVSVNTPM